MHQWLRDPPEADPKFLRDVTQKSQSQVPYEKEWTLSSAPRTAKVTHAFALCQIEYRQNVDSVVPLFDSGRNAPKKPSNSKSTLHNESVADTRPEQVTCKKLSVKFIA